MAFKIIWSPPALGDLRSLTDYIAEDNPSAAERMGNAILAKTRHLIEHPYLGRSVPELKRGDVRELVHRNYRIIYRINATMDAIEIMRVWHGARGEPEINESGD